MYTDSKIPFYVTVKASTTKNKQMDKQINKTRIFKREILVYIKSLTLGSNKDMLET